MRITVECYGATQRWCGTPQLELELPEAATVADALQALAQRYPELAVRRATLAAAIGDEIVAGTRPLDPRQPLALIPPVSGG